MSARDLRAASELPDEPEEAAAVPGGAVEPWPRGISRRASMRISDVLGTLQLEFPAVTPSKLRFLEEQGLVGPVRTPAGYRQYSPADVERLRFVLRLQRDRYMPLKVIGERLAALDAGEEDEPASKARLVASGGEVHRTQERLSADALAREAGVEPELVDRLVEAGVLAPRPGGSFDPWAREVVAAAGALAEHGIDVRHLRQFRTAAERQVDLVEQVVAPLRGQRSASSRAHAATLAAEVGELCARMHTALVRAAVADVAP
ncbi:transcriptional regulator FtsR [Cellulomonas composti]|uniref:MerR family transcriptional regulator n=1 Tax=Cellulomonas composti TaxID=266130 RepID=A0A511J6C9_9CELL|nr:MerR family transcriptional regulator [Cellulomonas composti]GEL93551.1 MerR family transcriptional regulator [Cellulomonas composti]